MACGDLYLCMNPLTYAYVLLRATMGIPYRTPNESMISTGVQYALICLYIRAYPLTVRLSVTSVSGLSSTGVSHFTWGLIYLLATRNMTRQHLLILLRLKMVTVKINITPVDGYYNGVGKIGKDTFLLNYCNCNCNKYNQH